MPRAIRNTSPRHRKGKMSNKPSRAEAAHPIGPYLIPPHDPSQRSVSVSVTMMPHYQRKASEIAIQNDFGFGTQQDVFRWCVDFGLTELDRRRNNGEVPDDTKRMAGWLRMIETEMEQQKYLIYFQDTANNIETLMIGGNHERALEMARRIQSDVDQLKSKHWRERYVLATRSIVKQLKSMGIEDGLPIDGRVAMGGDD